MVQIHAAIEHAKAEQYECAITLAAAAEGLLPDPGKPYLHRQLRETISDQEKFDFNEVINWLKHSVGPDTKIISDFEVAVAILRAISKFNVATGKVSREMRDFEKFALIQYEIHPPDDFNAAYPDPE